MKPGYQLEPVIKKPLSFVSLDIASNFQFSKKKEKNKKTKAINLSQYRHSFYFIFFLCFFLHQKHLGNFHTITRERISDTDDFISQIWHFLDSDGQSVKEKELFKIRPPLCSMSSEACNKKRLSFVYLYLNMFTSTNTRNPRSVKESVISFISLTNHDCSTILY